MKITKLCLILFFICFFQTLQSAPVIDLLTPDAASKNVQTPVTIRGQGFDISCNAFLFSKPEDIVFLKNIDTINAIDVVVLGKYAYVADISEVKVIDIATSATKATIKCSTTKALFIYYNYLYIADDVGGIQVVNIINPAFPVVESTIIVNKNGIKALDIFVKDNIAYILDLGVGKGLYLYDVENPGKPVFLSYFNTSVNSGDVPGSIYVSGKYAYIANGLSGLKIIDISYSKDPKGIKDLSLPPTDDLNGSANDVFVLGDFAYVADKVKGVFIIDISSPGEPRIISTICNNILDDEPYGVSVSGDYAFLANGGKGIKVFDVFDPAYPKFIGSRSFNKKTKNVYVSGWNVFFANEDYGIQIINNFFSFTKALPQTEYRDNKTLITNITKGFAKGIYELKVANSLNESSAKRFEILEDLYETTKPPVFNAINTYNSTSINENENVFFTVSATDHNKDFLYYDADGLPSGASFDPQYQSFNWTPTFDQSGDHKIYFKVYDGYYIDYAEMKIFVKNVNRKPVFSAIENQVISEGELLELKIEAIDPDKEDELIYSADSLPLGSNFDTSTNIFFWKPNFDQTGEYTVSFKVTDGDYVEEKVITINVANTPALPKITLEYSTTNIKSPFLIVFIANVENDNNSIIEYAWDFDGDGINDAITEINRVSYYYEKSGKYSVKATVTNDVNLSSYSEVVITLIENPKPKISLLYFAPEKGIVNSPVLFTVNATDDEQIIEYAWDFDGDNIYEETTTTKNINHTFTEAKVYNLIVKVTDNNGDYITSTKSIRVFTQEDERPAVTLNATPLSGQSPLTVTFTANVSIAYQDLITKYIWDFDGNDIYDDSTRINKFTFSYSKNGSYTAKVKVIDKYGDNNINTVTINVTSNSASKDKKKKLCLINHLTSNNNHINILLKLRDTKLIPNNTLKHFVSFYYKLSTLLIHK